MQRPPDPASPRPRPRNVHPDSSIYHHPYDSASHSDKAAYRLFPAPLRPSPPSSSQRRPPGVPPFAVRNSRSASLSDAQNQAPPPRLQHRPSNLSEPRSATVTNPPANIATASPPERQPPRFMPPEERGHGRTSSAPDPYRLQNRDRPRAAQDPPRNMPPPLHVQRNRPPYPREPPVGLGMSMAGNAANSPNNFSTSSLPYIPRPQTPNSRPTTPYTTAPHHASSSLGPRRRPNHLRLETVKPATAQRIIFVRDPSSNSTRPKPDASKIEKPLPPPPPPETYNIHLDSTTDSSDQSRSSSRCDSPVSPLSTFSRSTTRNDKAPAQPADDNTQPSPVSAMTLSPQHELSRHPIPPMPLAPPMPLRTKAFARKPLPPAASSGQLPSTTLPAPASKFQTTSTSVSYQTSSDQLEPAPVPDQAQKSQLDATPVPETAFTAHPGPSSAPDQVSSSQSKSTRAPDPNPTAQPEPAPASEQTSRVQHTSVLESNKDSKDQTPRPDLAVTSAPAPQETKPTPPIAKEEDKITKANRHKTLPPPPIDVSTSTQTTPPKEPLPSVPEEASKRVEQDTKLASTSENLPKEPSNATPTPSVILEDLKARIAGTSQRAAQASKALEPLGKDEPSLLATLEDLAKQSEALHARYTGLRSERQKLASSIMASLKSDKPGPEYVNTMLDKQVSLAAINSSMDICFAKLKSLDYRKEEAVNALLSLLSPKRTPSATKGSATKKSSDPHSSARSAYSRASGASSSVSKRPDARKVGPGHTHKESISSWTSDRSSAPSEGKRVKNQSHLDMKLIASPALTLSTANLTGRHQSQETIDKFPSVPTKSDSSVPEPVNTAFSPTTLRTLRAKGFGLRKAQADAPKEDPEEDDTNTLVPVKQDPQESSSHLKVSIQSARLAKTPPPQRPLPTLPDRKNTGESTSISSLASTPEDQDLWTPAEETLSPDTIKNLLGPDVRVFAEDDVLDYYHQHAR